MIETRNEDLKVIPAGGRRIISSKEKQFVSMRMEITPVTVRKNSVTWLHNNKEIVPRYRIRLVQDRREVSNKIGIVPADCVSHILTHIAKLTCNM